MSTLPSRATAISRGLPGQTVDADESAHEGAVTGRLEAVGHSIVTFLGPIVILDFLMGFSVILVAEQFIGNMPTGLLTSLVMVFVGMCRRARLKVAGGGLMVIAFMALCVFLAVESHQNGMPWTQRIVKFAILFCAACMLASGRINIRSLIVGGMVGLLINMVMFYLGLTTNFYPPFLTGFFGDKNVAGMYYALFGILGLLAVPKMMEIPWIGISGVLVFLTGSRTAMGAFVLALAWILLRNRIGIVFRIFLAALGWFLFQFAVSDLASNSAFGDRSGDDWYRHQVEMAMNAKVAVTPWYGLGLNQGFVVLGGVRNEWFHNSYQQAFVEGGYIFLIATIVAFVILGLGLLDRKTVISASLLRAEAAIIIILICATKLGEVFMTFGGFTALGIALAYRCGRPVDGSDLAWVVEERGGSSSTEDATRSPSIDTHESRRALDPAGRR